MNETTRMTGSSDRTAARGSADMPGAAREWRRLQAGAAIVAVISFIIPMVLDGKLEGFLLAMAAPFVVGIVLSRWLPRTGAIFLGVVSVATLLASAPFIISALTHPESATDFISLLLLTLSCIVGAAAAIPAYREARSPGAGKGRARAVAAVAAAVALVAMAVSVVAASRVQDVDAQPGDLAVQTADFAFAPAKLDASAGAVAVHLTNTDSTRHTFTIDGVTDVSVPPNSSQRATFEAQPGTYRFYCIPHAAGMEGQLVVE